MRATLNRTAAAAAVALVAVLPALTATGQAAVASGGVVVTEADVVRQAEDTPPTSTKVLYTRLGTPSTAAAFVDGPGVPPSGTGSLQLTTVTASEKVFLSTFDRSGLKLSDVTALGYSTYRSAGSGSQVAALNMVIDFNGPAVAGGFSTLVFEPVYNTGQGAVTSGTWQGWDAFGSGRWWSTRAIGGQCAGATDACFTSWSDIVAHNPDATLTSYGVNQGSGNEGLVSAVDALRLNSTVLDFERIKDGDGNGVADTAPPTSADQCKKDGYTAFDNPSFRNQGECVSYVSTHK